MSLPSSASSDTIYTMIKNLADSPMMKYLAAAAVAWLFLPAILICIRIVYAILSCIPTIF